MSAQPPATGAQPEGTHTETDAAANVQRMFDTIAPTYDRANHLLSFGLDRLWWRRASRALRPLLKDPGARILDLCCGTGDMTAALLNHRPEQAKPILGGDFAPEMLTRARQKHALANARFVHADALQLPFASGSFELVTFAFGFRNLANYADGLAEVHRVLTPGGAIAILECNQPPALQVCSIRFISSGSFPLWAALFQDLPLHIATFRPPSSAFPGRHACCP